MVVWCYDVDMAENEILTEDDVRLARTQGPDLGPLGCLSISELKAWMKLRAPTDSAL